MDPKQFNIKEEFPVFVELINQGRKKVGSNKFDLIELTYIVNTEEDTVKYEVENLFENNIVTFSTYSEALEFFRQNTEM